MPQPKKHKSAKARQQANREKSKKHYHLNKETINSRRRRQYQEKEGKISSIQKPIANQGHTLQGELPLESERNPVDTWLERASRIHGRFLKYLDGSNVQFLHKACREYLKEGNSDSIINNGNMMQSYRLSILRCHENVLQLTGIGKELEQIDSMVQEVKTIIDWLDEVEMAALEDFDEVQRSYHKGAFDFQKRC